MEMTMGLGLTLGLLAVEAAMRGVYSTTQLPMLRQRRILNITHIRTMGRMLDKIQRLALSTP
jgi:hypothetical protein